jgi:hypothetical protein
LDPDTCATFCFLTSEAAPQTGEIRGSMVGLEAASVG